MFCTITAQPAVVSSAPGKNLATDSFKGKKGRKAIRQLNKMTKAQMPNMAEADEATPSTKASASGGADEGAQGGGESF